MRKKVFLLLAGCLLAATGWAQSVLLEEGFENETSGWTIVNGSQINRWYRGTATKASGSYSMYISSNSGTSNTYAVSLASVVHFYKDITFPVSAESESYILTFKWKGMGESNYDDLKVYLTPTTITPSAGTNPSSTYLNGTYRGNTAWQTATISLPAATYSGTTRRLVFTWKNDDSSGTTPPIAIDDISITNFPLISLQHIVYQINKTTQEAYVAGAGDVVLTDIVIPETVTYEGESYTVTRINNDAFKNYAALTSIFIPESVTSIGGSAFYGCSKLTSVAIPNNVTKIESSAFYGCTSLSSLTLPLKAFSDAYLGGLFYTSSSGSTPTGYIRQGSLSGTYYYVPASLKTVSITDDADIKDNFFKNTNLETINMLLVKSIGGSAFYGCSGLTSITIPESVTSIGSSAFSGCSAVQSITLGAGLTSLTGFASFYTYTNLASITIDASNTAYSSESGVLFNKSKTELICYPRAKSGNSYSIPSSVTSIDGSAFSGCTGLTSITIPNSVTSIGGSAFSGCTAVQSITLGAGLTSLSGFYSGGFHDYPKLASIMVDAGSTAYSSADGMLFNKSKTALIWYPRAKSGNSYSVPNSVTGIGSYAFQNCHSLTNITIPNSVTSIESSAFSGCTSLYSLTLPLTSVLYNDRLGDIFYVNSSGSQFDSSSRPTGYVYQGYVEYSSGSYRRYDHHYVPTSLKIITITDNANVRNDFFYNCTNLQTINMPLVKSIGDNAFSGCSGLTSITIPNSVTSIGSYAFFGCTNLVKVITPSLNGFFFTDKLQELTVAPTCTSIPANSLAGATNLQELSLPFIGISSTATGSSGILGALFGTSTAANAVTQYYADGQSGKYAIPASLKKLTVTSAPAIGYGALYNCDMLQELTLGSAVRKVSEKALYGCGGLEHIYAQWAYPPTAYNNSTFEGVNKFACTLHVPSGSSDWYSEADGWKEFNFVQGEAAIVVSAFAVPLRGGEISGLREYERNVPASLTAMPNANYIFHGWLEGETAVSSSNIYSFTATAPRTLYSPRAKMPMQASPSRRKPLRQPLSGTA